MSIATETARVSYTLTSATQTLSVPFFFLANSEIRVIKKGDAATADVDLVLVTDYSVSGALDPAGGSITLTGTGTAIGDVIVIVRSAPLTQPLSFTMNGDFSSTATERGLDRIVMRIQQLYESIRRCLRLPLSDSEVGELTAPDRAGTLIGFDSAGDLDLTNTPKTIVAAAVAQALAAGDITSLPSINVMGFGATGDGATDDTTAVQAAIDVAQEAGGGTVVFPVGTYLVSNLSITKSGVWLQGMSDPGVVLKITSGSAGTYAVNVNLSGVGPARPLSFGIENLKIEGDSTTDRTYSGLMLYNVYKPVVRNLHFRALDKCITGRAAFYGDFSSCWFEHYNTGIEGYDAAFSLNTNTLTAMQFIEGNADDSAIPFDGTFATNNSIIGMSVGSSVDNGNASIIGGTDNTFIGLRLESITSTSHWMTLGNRNRLINPSISSQVALASGKYVIAISGDNNEVECPSNGSNITRLIRCDAGSRYNRVHVTNVKPIGTLQPLLDLGTFNYWRIGQGDHVQGNEHGGMAVSWSDVPVENLIVSSINFGGLFTLDGLTNAIDNTERGPDGRGGVYLLNTPTGNREVTCSIGSHGANTCFAMSFWAKAVSGGEQTIQATLSESPSSDYDDVTITSEQWTRVLILRKFSTGPLTRKFAVRLPVAHPGIYWKGPQVVNLGDNATSGEISPVIWGGYVPTDAAIRRDPSPRDSWRFQQGAPTGGLWYRGDRVIDLTCSAGGASPGLVCITDGEPGTWKAEAVVAA